jgi:hypothetical protein
MKSIEIESWALRILGKVESRLPVEDLGVELKADWPDPAKAARRIAGHANAARGETILWLIGADEKQGVVNGVNYQDLANWFPQVKSCFESEIPVLQDLNVDYKGSTVVALCFDTSRFPYVVKNAKGGEIQFEVPWRDATMVRSATRRDLVLMLSPLLRMPRIQVLGGRICFTVTPRSDDTFYACTLELYVVPLGEDSLTFPFHKASAILTGSGKVISEDLMVTMGSWKSQADQHNMLLRGRPDRSKEYVLPSDSIRATEDEAVIKGAGKVVLLADTGKLEHCDVPEMHLSVRLVEAITEMRIALGAEFKHVDQMTWDIVGAGVSSHF